MTITYSFSHAEPTTAAPAAVRALWQDVEGWPEWDAGVTKVELTGGFTAGATGTMHLAGQPPVAFTLVSVTPAGFVDETPIPGGVLRFSHTVEARPGGGALVTHRVEIEDAAELAGRLGPAVTEDTPDSVRALVALAERRVPQGR
jgi:Polyketide cyclase / dehydrase and lipid transport